MQTFIKKITSRKFLTCIAGVVLGICMIFGLDENTVSTIAGAITAIASIVSYILAESKIDASAVDGIKDAANKVIDAVDSVEKIEE